MHKGEGEKPRVISGIRSPPSGGPDKWPDNDNIQRKRVHVRWRDSQDTTEHQSQIGWTDCFEGRSCDSVRTVAGKPPRKASSWRKAKNKKMESMGLDELVMWSKKGATNEEADKINKCTPKYFGAMYIFGNSPLETTDGRRVKFHVSHFHLASKHVVSRNRWGEEESTSRWF